MGILRNFYSFKCHQLSLFGYRLELNARKREFGTQIALSFHLKQKEK